MEAMAPVAEVAFPVHEAVLIFMSTQVPPCETVVQQNWSAYPMKADVYAIPPRFHIEEMEFRELKGLFELYRDYMKHEDDLINQRSTWHLVLQGFLFATLGVIGEWPVAPGPDRLYLERWFLVYVLAVAGAVIAGFAYVSVKAANDSINSLCSKWHAILGTYELETKAYLPALAGGGHPDAMKNGKRPAMRIPLVIACAWVLIFAISVVDRVYPHSVEAKTGTSKTGSPLAPALPGTVPLVPVPSPGR